MTLNEMIDQILCKWGTYRATEEQTGIAKATLHDIRSGKTSEDNLTLSTYRKIEAAYKEAIEDVGNKSKRS